MWWIEVLRPVPAPQPQGPTLKMRGRKQLLLYYIGNEATFCGMMKVGVT